MMQRTLLMVGTMCLCLSTGAHAGGFVRTDGVWWNSLDSSEKKAAVTLLTNAVWFVFMNTKAQDNDVVVSVANGDPHFKARDANALGLGIDWHGKEPTYSKRSEIYVSAISSFYKEHPGRLDVNVTSLMLCLSDHPIGYYMFACRMIRP